ncbi:phage holin family protein [Aeromicrobium sp. NPDC092404]|uniref:phage holin family protein n=1 Tax=Aeromicrobium sp. NPDC092404 TaxID=3154976 RepID=UPI003420A78E
MTPPRVPTSQASTGELIAQASDDISTLIRSEIQLAKQDLATSGKRLGVGAGLFGFAGTLALYGLGALVAAGIIGIAEALDAWLAALIVAGGLFVVAGIAALIGKARVSRVAKGPRERVESVKADVAAARPGGTS